MDQETWNTLFSWITGRQCFIPEGCDPPLIGVLFYAGFLIFIGLMTALYVKHEDEIMEKVRGWRR